ncbi:high mobility group box, partial [Auriscalpium vulgare]
IPRPPNAFMVFRSSWLKSNDGMLAIERDNRQLSRITGEVWRAMSDADKAPYQKHAQDLKEEHARQYPNYRFSPKPRTGEILRRQ